ncbi:MAG: SRPBCC family protein [Armatimonadetes bacterium]|nr:SRPBCC family protein [Armatimonadota bacterium]MCX6946236.1 SRPBCC family protein [Opitutales bacterium]
MPRIELVRDVAAPPQRVYEIARKVEDFPTFMEDLQSITILETSADGQTTLSEWVGLIRDFRMTIKWVQEDAWDAQQLIDTFRMVRGDMDAMSGEWRFEPVGTGTRFVSVLEYEYNVPLIGPMIKALIRKKMEGNLAAQMQAIKERAEQPA